MKVVAALSLSLCFWTHALAAVPPAPAPQNPAADAVLQPVSLPLSWAAATGALTYHVQVSKDADFDPLTVDDSALTLTYANVGPLANNTLYHWRVRARNADGVGAWSADRAFTTLPAAPVAVVLALPANAAVNVALKPALYWRKQSNADGYTLQVSAKADFSTTVISTGLLTDTTYAIGTALDNGLTYYWRVQARNQGGAGPYSTGWSFTTLPAAPPAPALMAPADDAAQLPLPIGFSWHKADRATGYDLQISTVNTFQSLVLDSSIARGDTVCAYGKLNWAATYYWRVRASNAGGNSAYTATRTFSTLEKPVLPVPVSPADFVIDLPNAGVKLMWRKSARAANYRAQVSAKADFSTLISSDSVTDTTRTLGNLPHGAYFWRVEARNAAGTSGFSAVWHFSTRLSQPAVPPVLIAPAYAATGVSLNPTLIWNRSAGAILYRIQVSAFSNFSTLIDRDSAKTDTTRAVGPLLPEQTYYWRVEAVNADGASEYSEVRSFTTKAGAVGAVALISPADSAGNVDRSPTLVWKPAPGAARYRVQISGTSDFAARIVDDSAVTDTTRAVGPLDNGKTYYWRVAAANSAGAGDFSAVRKFTVIESQPDSPALKSPADGAKNLEATVVLRWAPLAGAKAYRVEVSLSPTFSAFAAKDTAVLDTSYTLNALAAGETFYWRVQARNAAGTGPYTEIRAFTTQPAVGLRAAKVSLQERVFLSAGPSGAMLEFFVPQPAHMAIDLIEIGSGRRHSLVAQAFAAGTYRMAAPRLPSASGVYVLSLVSGSYREAKRVVIP